MRKLLLLVFLALMAIPTFAQSSAPTTPTHRPPMRDPFAKPKAEALRNVTITTSAEDIGADGKLATEEAAPVAAVPAEDTTVVARPASETATESYALMEEPDNSASDNVMWVLGGIAALGLIGALAYVILGMGSPDNTVYNA